MKILILTNNDIGVYKFRKELLMALIEEKHQVFVSLPDGEFIPEIEKLGCKVLLTEISRHGINPFEDLNLFAKYRYLLKKIRPDIVFTYTIKPNIYGGIACAIQKIPYVSNITGLGTAVEKKGILQLITVNLYRYAMRKAKTVFFQNRENEEFFSQKNIAIGKHKMIPGSGVNLIQYKVTPYPNSNTVDFVFISRIMKEKGIEQYLDAAKEIRKKYPETRFHICGFYEQEYEEKLKKLDADGIIVYHGMVSNIVDIHRFSSCTIHPTYYPEGISNVLLESCACGRPIITTDRSGCREVVDDGVNGFIVKQKDSMDLIKQIEKFLSLSWEERKQMGLAGRKKVEKEFNRQIVINKYLAEVKEC